VKLSDQARISRVRNMMKMPLCCLFLFFCLFFWSSPTIASNGEFIEITVVENDYLINICKKYLEDPRKWQTIAKINSLSNPDLIFPGQKLLFPVKLLKGIPIDGKVTFIKGNVMTQEKGSEEWSELFSNDLVKQGSGIKTGDEGTVEVTFEDGASFLLRPGTTLKINNAIKKGSFNFIRNLYLFSGRTISRFKEAFGKDSRFEIHTPSAIAAARGTVFRVSVDDREAMRSEVLKGTIGVEAMRQTVELNEGEGTLVRMNEPPLKPRKLLSPPELIYLETIYKTMPLKLQFKEIKGALFYRVMLARDPGLKDVIHDKVFKIDETLELIDVDDGEYFLQSRSIDSDGLEGLPSEPITFKVRVNPLPPFIQTPIDGSEYKQKSVQCQWLKVKDAVRYHVQISEDREFNRIIIDKNDIKDTGFITSSLNYGSYYFRVNSIAEDDYEGAPSDTLSFTVMPPPPSVEKPEVDEKEIRIRWRNLGEGITYHFQMSAEPEFKKIVIDKKTEKPTITLQKPEKTGTYFVRTSSLDTKGHESDFSLPQSFEIKHKLFLPLAIVGVVALTILILL
jgi:hypothetical protein